MASVGGEMQKAEKAYKTITHVAAVVFLTAAGFVASPAGRAVVSQYPKLASAAGFITAIGALYFSPKKAS